MSDRISQNIVKFRKKAGLSQEELAEKLHLTRQTISKWETGNSAPDVDSVALLCSELSVSADELLGLGGKETSAKEKTDWFYPFFYAFLLLLFVTGVVMYLMNNWTLALYGYYVYGMDTAAIGLCAFSGVVFLAMMVYKLRKRKKSP